MYKLIVKLSNYPSPLEPIIVADGLIKTEINVEDIDNVQDILDKVEKLVEDIDNQDKGAISVEVSNDLRGVILHGTVKEGLFSGVVCS